MTFEEASKLLNDGKRIRRTDWTNEDCYVAFDAVGSLSHYIICKNKLWVNNYCLTKRDFDSDWEEYEELLSTEEKEFLRLMIKLSRDAIFKVSISRSSYGDKNCLKLYDQNDEYECTPYIKQNYFKYLENEKEYTLSELGLIDY